MLIESYDIYHIGAKLSVGIQLNALKTRFIDQMKKSGFKIELREEHGFIHKDILGSKNGVSIELNHSAGALNAIGHDSAETTKVFNESIELLEKSGYENPSTVLFYEVICSMNVKTQKPPSEILAKTVKVDASSVSSFCDAEMTGFRITTLKQTKNRDAINFHIDVSPTSPNSRLMIRIEYRAESKSRVDEFGKKHGEMVEKILASLH